MQMVGAQEDRERSRCDNFFMLDAGLGARCRPQPRDDPTGLVLDRDRPRSENIVCPNPLQASFGLDPKNYMWKQPFLQLLFHKYPTTSGLVNVAGF